MIRTIPWAHDMILCSFALLFANAALAEIFGMWESHVPLKSLTQVQRDIWGLQLQGGSGGMRRVVQVLCSTDDHQMRLKKKNKITVRVIYNYIMYN